jgi:hypothetical protein
MSETQFPVEDMDGDTPGSKTRLLDARSYYFPADLIDFEEFIDEEAVLGILLQVRIYCYDLNIVAKDNSIPIPDNIDLHSRVGWLLQRLLQKPPDGIFRTALTECCRFASAIFLFFPFDNHFPDPTLLLNSLLHKLKDALSRVVPCSAAEHQLMIWLLAVGGVTAAKLPAERDWFIGYLIDTAADMEVHSWDELERCLRRVIWMDAMNDLPFRELWEDTTLIAKSQTAQNPFGAICCD